MEGVYRHLDIRERAVIEMQLELGTRPSVIARCLNRSRSTIPRELHRNGWRHRGVSPRPGRKMPTGGYHCESAEGRAHSTLGPAKLWAGEHLQNCSCPKGHLISCNTGLRNHNPLHLRIESDLRQTGTLTNLRPLWA